MRGFFVVLGAIVCLVALPAVVSAGASACDQLDFRCRADEVLRNPYTGDYLATTPEKIGVAGPGCVRGQTDPRLPGTCFPAVKRPAADPDVDADGAGGDAGTQEGSAGNAGASGQPAPPPPPPPTPGEALATCPQPPSPQMGVNPQQRGITGLPTYLWAGPAGPVTGGGTVRGYAIGCAVEPVRWTFTTGDGARYIRSRPGGPAPDHVVEHVYDTRNKPDEDYILTLTVTWRRSTGVGGDTVTTSDSRPYHVVEVRSAPGG